MTAKLETGRWVAHMDCDAFFYSCECLRDPELIGKPVIVAGSGPRAVVTTASYEARRYGVGSAMPAARAKRLCPHAIIVAPHGDLYRSKSKEVWGIVREALGRELQHASIDEAYVDLTGLSDFVPRLREVVAEVQARTGITISVGVGPSRLVAKCCSDFKKPAGFVVMSREEACVAFAAQPARTLPGVGPKTAERLLGMGVATVLHLQVAAEAELVESFGERYGRELKARAHFYDDAPVVTERVAKSKSTEHTFDADVSDRELIAAELTQLARKLSDQLRDRELRGRTVGIKVRLDDWTTVTRDHSLPEPTNDAEIMVATALALLAEYDPPRPVRLLGVRVAAFTETGVLTAPAAPKTSAPKADSRRRHEQLVLPGVTEL